MKVCLIMCNSSKYKTEHFTGLCLSANYIYCQKHKYDFKVFTLKTRYINQTPKITCQSLNTGKYRHAAWGKIICMYNVLRYYTYDYIVYIDNDAFFLPEKDIQSIIQSNIDSDILFAVNTPFVFSYVNISKYSKYSKNTSKPKNTPCSGMFILRNNNNVLNFLKDWYLQEPETPQDPNTRPWDQAGLWDLYCQQLYNIQLLQNSGFVTRCELQRLKNNEKTNKIIIHDWRKKGLTSNFIENFYPSLLSNDIYSILNDTSIHTKISTQVDDIKFLFNMKETILK